MLLLVLCSAPAEAYRLSYILPAERYKVVVLDSLERCLQFLEGLPYLPDAMVVEEDDLAGGAAAANRAIAAVRRRLGPADLPLLRVVRGGVSLGAPGGSAPGTAGAQRAQQRQAGLPAASGSSRATDLQMGLAAGDTLLAPFEPAELDARVTARVTLRRLHQQRAAAHATLAVLRHLLPPPAFADLARGTPWAARAHADVSVLSAVLLDPHGVAVALTPAGEVAAAAAAAAPLVGELHDLLAAFDGLCDMHGVTKVGMLGGEYVAAAGLTGSTPEHLERLMRVADGMVAAAGALQAAASAASAKAAAAGPAAPVLEVQIGLHTGSCVSGVVGRTRPSFVLMGEAAALATDLRNSGHPMTVHVSSVVRDRLASRASGLAGGGGGDGGGGEQGARGPGGALPPEFSFAAAAAAQLYGGGAVGLSGPSGLGPARTYLLQVGKWREALAASGPSMSGGAAGGGAAPHHRVLRRSTHSSRALMAAAAAAGAAAAAASPDGAGGALYEHGAQHHLPARALSTSSIETRRQAPPVVASAVSPGAAEGASPWQSASAPPVGAAAAEYGAVAASVALHGQLQAQQSELQSPFGSAQHVHSPTRVLGPAPPAAAAASASGGGGAAPAPRRGPPTRRRSNLSNSSSLFAPSERTHGSSGVTGWGAGAALGAGLGVGSVATAATQGSDTSSQQATAAADVGGGRGGARQQQQQQQPAQPSQAALARHASPASYMLALQHQHQQHAQPQHQHQQQHEQPAVQQQRPHEPRRASHSAGAPGQGHPSPSSGLPTVDEDLSGPAGLSGSLGGFTAALALQHMSHSGVSFARSTHSAGPSERLGNALSSASGVSLARLEGALTSTDVSGGAGHGGMGSGRTSAEGPSSWATGGAGRANGGSGAALHGTAPASYDGVAGSSVAGTGSGSGPYVMYTNLTTTTNSDAGGRGSAAGPLFLSGAGQRGILVGASTVQTTDGAPFTAAAGAAPGHGITHAELLMLLASSSVARSREEPGAAAAAAATLPAGIELAPIPKATIAAAVIANGTVQTMGVTAAPALEPAVPIADKPLGAARSNASQATGDAGTPAPPIGGRAASPSAAATAPSPPAPVVPRANTSADGANRKILEAVRAAAAVSALTQGQGEAQAREQEQGLSAYALMPVPSPDLARARASADAVESLNRNHFVGTAELAMLLQVAGRSVGGNSASSISFPRLQELASATLRDAGPARTQGSTLSAGSSFALMSQLQLLTASVDNGGLGPAPSSQDSAELTATLRGGLAGLVGPPPSSGGGSGGAGAPGLPATASAVRRRSAELQRALLNAAAAGAAAAAARSSVQVGVVPALAPQRGPDGGEGVVEAQAGREPARPAAGAATAPDDGAGLASVGRDPTPSATAAAAGARSGLAASSSTLTAVPALGAAATGAGGRARPAAGPYGGTSMLSTVPDEATPPTSSCLNDYNSRPSHLHTTNVFSTTVGHAAVVTTNATASSHTGNQQAGAALGAAMAAADAATNSRYGGNFDGPMGHRSSQQPTTNSNPRFLKQPLQPQQQPGLQLATGLGVDRRAPDLAPRDSRASEAEPLREGGGDGPTITVLLGPTPAASEAAAKSDGHELGVGRKDEVYVDIMSSEAPGISSSSMAAAAEAACWAPRGTAARRHSGSFTTMRRRGSPGGSPAPTGAGMTAGAPRPSTEAAAQGRGSGPGAVAGLPEAAVPQPLLCSSMAEVVPYGTDLTFMTRTDVSSAAVAMASSSGAATTQQPLLGGTNGGGALTAVPRLYSSADRVGAGVAAIALKSAGSNEGANDSVRSARRSPTSLAAAFFQRRKHKQRAERATSHGPGASGSGPPPALVTTLPAAAWQNSGLYTSGQGSSELCVTDTRSSIPGEAAAGTSSLLASSADPWVSRNSVDAQQQRSSPRVSGSASRQGHKGGASGGGLSGLLRTLSFGKKRGSSGTKGIR